MSSSTNTPESELASIRQELNELRQTVAALHSNGNGHYNGNGTSVLEAAESTALTDRRGMMKKMAGLAVGVAAVGLLRPSVSKAGNYNSNSPLSNGRGVPDVDGQPVLLGSINSATAGTIVNQANGAGINGGLMAQNASATVLNTGGLGAPLVGRNFASTIATIPTGATGVFGGANPNGSTTPNVDVFGVYGSAQSAGSGIATGVFGTGDDVGVSGSGPIGVLGTGSGGGCGVDGVNNGASTVAFGVRGLAGTGLGGFFAGARGAVGLGTGAGAVANPNTTPPAGGGTGDLYRGSTSGSLWYNTGTAYRRLADATTAGALTLLATPVRYVDTRNGTGGATGPFAPGEVRSYNFVTLQPGTIPAGATGIVGNIVAVSPNTTGNLQINTANSFPPGSAAVLNFNPGQDIANHFVSALSAGSLMFVKANPNGGSVQLVIDIYGYYL